MPIETSEFAEEIERLTPEVENAAELIRTFTEMGDVNTHMPFNHIGNENYDLTPPEREAHGNNILEILKTKFEFTPETTPPVRTYTTQGAAKSKGEGIITVEVFPTNDSNIFIGKRTHKKGEEESIDWTIRGLHGDY